MPSSINLDLKLGKQNNASKAVETSPAPGTKKTVLNAPFGLATLTITTTAKNHTGCKHKEHQSPPPSSIAPPIPKPEQNTPIIPSSSSTTTDFDALIGEIFGPTSSSSAPAPGEVNTNDREITGEGSLDVRMPKA